MRLKDHPDGEIREVSREAFELTWKAKGFEEVDRGTTGDDARSGERLAEVREDVAAEEADDTEADVDTDDDAAAPADAPEWRG